MGKWGELTNSLSYALMPKSRRDYETERLCPLLRMADPGQPACGLVSVLGLF